MRTLTKRPRLDPTEHPRPQVMVPFRIFSDLFFRDNYERVGRWVHHWNWCVWKKDPYGGATHVAALNPDEVEDALRWGWLVRDRRRGLRMTGPVKDKRWLLDKKRSWSTYFVEAVGQSLIKIGKSTNVEKRIDSLQVASAFDLHVIAVIEGDHEHEWHRRFNADRTGGEWFRFTDELRAAISRLEAA